MSKTSKYLPILFFLLGFGVCIVNTWGPSIYILDEAKNATCAREMLESMDIFQPTFNYELRTDKPPLHYFFMMWAYEMFGVNELAARFFSAVFGGLAIMITFWFTSKLYSETAGWIAAITLLASAHFAIQFHLAVPDPYLVFFITLSCFSFIYGFLNENVWFTYLAYLSIGLGMLAKGPIAMAIPGLSVLCFIIFTGRFNLLTIFQFKPISGLALSFVSCGWWYAGSYFVTDGAWTRGFFIGHNIERFADPKEGHGGNFWLTIVFVIIGMLPFSFFIIQSLRMWWRSRGHDFLMFCGVVALVVILFFTFSATKLPNYTVPAYPFLAVLLGAYLAQAIRNNQFSNAFRISALIMLVVTAALPAILYFGVSADPQINHLKDDVIWLVGCSFLALAGIYFYTAKQPVNMIFSVTLAFVWFSVTFFSVLFPRVDHSNPVTQAWEQLDRERPYAHYARFNPSFAFYLKKPIPRLDTRAEIQAFFEQHPDGYLISRSDYLDTLQDIEGIKLIYEHRDLFETTKTVVYSAK